MIANLTFAFVLLCIVGKVDSLLENRDAKENQSFHLVPINVIF